MFTLSFIALNCRWSYLMMFACNLYQVIFKSRGNSELLFEKLAPSRPSSSIIVVDNKMKETFIISWLTSDQHDPSLLPGMRWQHPPHHTLFFFAPRNAHPSVNLRCCFSCNLRNSLQNHFSLFIFTISTTYFWSELLFVSVTMMIAARPMVFWEMHTNISASFIRVLIK